MRPIFIVGAPRSGTSLLRAILNRHPGIGLCDETYFFYYVYSRRAAFGPLADAENRRRAIRAYLDTNRIRRLKLDPDALSRYLFEHGATYESLFTALLEFYAQQGGKRRCGEKTPQHALVAETICALYPDCHLIHIVRDPRDVVASLLRMPWGSASIRANARVWRDCTAAALRAEHRPNYLRVSYEDLVLRPAGAIQQVCRFIGEEYSPAMLAGSDAERPGEWWFHRAHGDISTDRLETWRQHLGERQAALVDAVAAPLLERLGYAPSGERAGIGDRLSAQAEEFACRVREKAGRLPATWYHWFQPTRLAAEEAWLDRCSHSAAAKPLQRQASGAGR